MAEYELTTEEVRSEWAMHRADSYALVIGYGADGVALAEFDRWLKAHDREVAAWTLKGAADALVFGDVEWPAEVNTIIRWLDARADTIERGE